MGIREIRLRNEYDMMKNMKGKVLDFTVNDTLDHYVITINVRTIIGVDGSGKPKYRDKSVVDLTFLSDYPKSYPKIKMRGEVPYHYNWYSDGDWCPGPKDPEETVWSMVRRMIRTLQFDPRYANGNSRANWDADIAAFMDNPQNQQMYFPCDKQELPIGDFSDKKPKIKINSIRTIG